MYLLRVICIAIYLSDIHPGGPTSAEVISDVISKRPSGAQVIFQCNFQAATGDSCNFREFAR